MMSRTTVCGLLVPVLSMLFTSQSVAQDSSKPAIGTEAAGTFAPAGPPLGQPVRVDAGGSCIIDLRQAYAISGTLSGSLESDYRIIVYSFCDTAAAGKYNEKWIAHGVFRGTIDGLRTSGTLTYTAQVRAGCEVEGRVSLGGAIDGDLAVSGNFDDGKLSYHGRVKYGWRSLVNEQKPPYNESLRLTIGAIVRGFAR